MKIIICLFVLLFTSCAEQPLATYYLNDKQFKVEIYEPHSVFGEIINKEFVIIRFYRNDNVIFSTSEMKTKWGTKTDFTNWCLETEKKIRVLY